MIVEIMFEYLIHKSNSLFHAIRQRLYITFPPSGKALFAGTFHSVVAAGGVVRTRVAVTMNESGATELTKLLQRLDADTSTSRRDRDGFVFPAIGKKQMRRCVLKIDNLSPVHSICPLYQCFLICYFEYRIRRYFFWSFFVSSSTGSTDLILNLYDRNRTSVNFSDYSFGLYLNCFIE